MYREFKKIAGMLQYVQVLYELVEFTMNSIQQVCRKLWFNQNTIGKQIAIHVNVTCIVCLRGFVAAKSLPYKVFVS